MIAADFLLYSLTVDIHMEARSDIRSILQAPRWMYGLSNFPEIYYLVWWMFVNNMSVMMGHDEATRPNDSILQPTPPEWFWTIQSRSTELCKCGGLLLAECGSSPRCRTFHLWLCSSDDPRTSFWLVSAKPLP